MLNKENIDTNGSTDWLHRNSSYQHHKIDNDSIHSNTSYFYYSGLSRSLMFTIRFSRKTMMPFSTNSNFMYIFKQQQYYRFRLCRFVLHACIGLMYNFIVLDWKKSTLQPSSLLRVHKTTPISKTGHRATPNQRNHAASPPRRPRTPAPRFPSAHVDGSLTATA